MTEVERLRDDLLASIGAALVQLNIGETNERDVCAKLEAFEAARTKQHDADTDLPIPEDDCQACKGTGMRAPDRICGACEGSGIAGAKHALPETEAVALRKIITAGIDVWGNMSCGVETEWVVDTILALLDGGDISDGDLTKAAEQIYKEQRSAIKAARETKKG